MSDLTPEEVYVILENRRNYINDQLNVLLNDISICRANGYDSRAISAAVNMYNKDVQLHNTNVKANLPNYMGGLMVKRILLGF